LHTGQSYQNFKLLDLVAVSACYSDDFFDNDFIYTVAAKRPDSRVKMVFFSYPAFMHLIDWRLIFVI